MRRTVVITAPAKIIAKSTQQTWADLGVDLILVTSNDSELHKHKILKDFKRFFSQIIFIDNYDNSDEVTYTLYKLLQRHTIETIIPMSEVDVLRVSKFSRIINKPWLSWEDALFFRNKYLMKHRLQQAGIPSAHFAKVSHFLDITNFIEQHGYPVIIKPIDGRGSNSIRILTNDEQLVQFAREDVIHSAGCHGEHIIETYLDGWEQYRVDGVYQNSSPVVNIAAKYVGSHLEYLNGGWLASYLLSPKNPLKRQLENFAEKVLDILPTPNSFAFHLEVFVKDQALIFSEVGIRLGGGSIIREIELSYGVNIRDYYIKAMLGSKLAKINCSTAKQISGQLHISPTPGKLIYIPNVCKHSAVSEYLVNYQPGDAVSAMNYTNAEIASFVFKANSETEAEHTILQLESWFQQHTIWEEP